MTPDPVPSDIQPSSTRGADAFSPVILTTPEGARVEAYPYGAHVAAWRPGTAVRELKRSRWPAGGDERLFLSRSAEFRPGAAIRGGVPVIFPQFAALGPLPKHGFARVLPWALVNATTASAHFQLQDSDATRRIWPHAFRAELAVLVSGNQLDLVLTVTNTGESPFSFTGALHTYLRVADIDQVSIEGLAGMRYLDSATGSEQVQVESGLRFAGEVDRIYFHAPPKIWVHEPGRVTEIRAAGFPEVVVWNPGAGRGAALADLEPDGYRRMVCVEAAVASRPVNVEPGQSWRGSQTLIAEGEAAAI